MKKVSILLLMIFLMTVLTGCSEEYISITEDESNAIAQYCSHLILKYDKNKTDDTKLLDYKDFKKQIDARNEAEIKPSEAPLEDPADETSDSADIPDNPTEQQEPTQVPTAAPEDVADTEPVVNECTIDEAFGLDGFTVEYRNLVVSDSYNTDDKFFALYASEGQKLAVVEFTVKNITNSEKRLDMTGEEIKYVLTDSKSSKHDPVLSFMTNDLQFYNEKIGANKEVTTCLVFYIKDGTAPASLKILGKNTYTINFN